MTNNLDDDEDDDYEFHSSLPQSTPTNTNKANLASNLNELNLLREEGKPSGLRNVGNTCWFNSIIQV